MGGRTLFASILLEDTRFVAQAITDFRMTEYGVECYFKRIVHPKTYALLSGSWST